jgi:polysaccharide pyruvyl transferase WcaK-like protein
MFVPAADEPADPVEPPHVILALNDEDAAQRFPEPGQRTAFLKALADELVKVLQRRELHLKLALHYFDDFRAAADFIDLLPPAFAHQRVSTFGPVPGVEAPAFYARYRHARAIIAMRVHSMSPALGLGCPTLALTTQARMREFLQELGLKDWGLAVDGPSGWAGEFARRLEDLLDHPARQAAALNLALLRQSVHKTNLALKETLGL